MFSPLASVRLRCLEIIPPLAQLGHQISLVPTDQLSERLAKGDHQDVDICIVYKTLVDCAEQLTVLKNVGTRIIVDVTEHLGENRVSGAFTRSLLPLADRVTVSSEGLAGLLRPIVECPVSLIEDCVEGPKLSQKADRPTNDLKLLWFGRSGNLGPLNDFLERWLPNHETIPVIFRVVTDLQNLDGGAKRAGIQYLDWSPALMREQFSWCHAAIFPASSVEIDRVKSTNRIQQALWSRRLPVGEHRDGVGDLARFGLFGESIEAVLPRIAAEWDDLEARVEAGWQEMEHRFAPSKLARKWHEAVIGATL